MRRLLVLASIVAFVDVVFYSAIIPLLPGYVHDLGLSKAQAGILSASYAAGTLIASLPAGLLATRVGPRRTLVGGLLLLGLASLSFGFAQSVVLLDSARFVQGAGGAMCWSGALAWLTLTADESKRGSVIGTALGSAVAGELLGPALGALAAQVGTKVVFASVLAVAGLLAAAALRIPDAPSREKERIRDLWRAMSSRPVVVATGLVTVPSILFGVVAVLGPLRINELGGGSALIAGTFMVGAGAESLLAPTMGKQSDRIGRQAPIAAGFGVCALGLLFIPSPDLLGIVIAALVLISIGAGVCFGPAMTMLSDSAEATGLHQGMAAGLMNLAWASGQVTGAVAGGAAAGAVGDWLPCYLVAALLLGTAVSLRAGTRGLRGVSAERPT
jgi:MFS family permease